MSKSYRYLSAGKGTFRNSRGAMPRAVLGMVAATFALLSVSFFCVCTAQESWAATPGGGWPTYQHDRARSGVSSEPVDLPLQEQWVYTAPAPPRPSWPDPQHAIIEGRYELPRARFDDAFYVAALDGAVYLGSSVDNQVHCLDASNGAVRWTFYTNGPVRLAPTVCDGRVYIGSDDGCVYCLRASDGELVWKFQAAPTDRRALGNGRMISLWPIRTGVLVDGGVAYFGAGVFPGERVYVYALNAEDGSVIWKENTIGDRAAGQTDFAPQGYLLASRDHLFVPSGRINKFCFDRKTGKFLKRVGSPGTYAMLDESSMYSGAQGGIAAHDEETGTAVFASFPGRRIIVTPDLSYLLNDAGVTALDRKQYCDAANQRNEIAKKRDALNKAKPEDLAEQLRVLGEEEKKAVAVLDASVRWRHEEQDLDSLILAGNVVLTGGQNRVIGLDGATGKALWAQKVAGRAAGLAVADGRLFVSTDQGGIHCFAGGAPPAPATPKRVANPYPKDERTALYERAAESILAETGVRKGYCLVLDCGEGRLAYELAQRADDLMIYGIEPDAEKVKAARKALSEAELYGHRVSVEQGDMSSLPYSDYFANLIVCDEMLVSGQFSAAPREVFRVLKPCGGVWFSGQPEVEEGIAQPLSQDRVRSWEEWASQTERFEVVRRNGTWAKYVRGPLEGAGSWTHQYGDAGNPASSADQLVKAPIGVLWFGEPGANRFPSRHARNVAPLSVNGRVFSQGVEFEPASKAQALRRQEERREEMEQELAGVPEEERQQRMRRLSRQYEGATKDRDLIVCYDAYNGAIYWEREIPGARRLGMATECGNLACTEDDLFVAARSNCHRLNVETGETQMTYETPPAEDGARREWAYVATVDGRLYGSAFCRGTATSRRGEHSDSIFAVDVESGKRLWTFPGTRIRNNTISIDRGRMLFADDRATTDARRAAARERVEKEAKEKGLDETAVEEALDKAEVRIVVCLDAETGERIWEKAVDLTGCGMSSLSGIAKNDVLLFCGSYSNGHYWGQFLKGEFSARRAVALSAKDGSTLWSKAIGYRTRPLVIGDTVYTDPWAFDLCTGEQKMRPHPFTGKPTPFEFERPGHHCGTVSGCPNLLFFRSWWVGYYDLAVDCGTSHFSSVRLGCWINMIAANGLVIQPEASSGCNCDYSNQCTVVYQPRQENKAWGIFASRGEMGPVRHMAVNLGAPGDRRDGKGVLWLSLPRPGGRMRMDVKADVKTLDGGGYFSRAAEYAAIGKTQTPWLYASGCEGLTAASIEIPGKEEKAVPFTVRLGFADAENSEPGERVFHILLQGEVVAKDFDIVDEAGGANRAVVKEFRGVKARDNLKIELVPKRGFFSRLFRRAKTLEKAQMPLLNTLEIVREDGAA
ncbi:MAG TPA: PQQ-binding-like beta-propeller repeat protein [Sumerlaeia bacterium]|nr:PQQ-binding-like beta-propeller repeat protein [Sumerlaeia bacterium]